MTNEQWLVYLWSIYPSGGYQIFYAIFLIAYLFFIIFALISHSDTSDRYKTETIWYKMGKWKIIIPSVLIVLLFLSNLVPSNRNHFLYIVATPYVVDSGKSIIESLQDPNSKLSKLNQMTDKALDKALKYLDENKQSEPEVKKWVNHLNKRL